MYCPGSIGFVGVIRLEGLLQFVKSLRSFLPGRPRCFLYIVHARRLAPIPQATLTPVAQAEEEVVAEAALEEEIETIVDVAVRIHGWSVGVLIRSVFSRVYNELYPGLS